MRATPRCCSSRRRSSTPTRTPRAPPPSSIRRPPARARALRKPKRIQTRLRRPRELEMQERLQKILAHAGVASRRKAEELISEGHVELKGKVVRELGTKADPAEDVIRVDGRQISEAEEKVWFVLYKPAGCVTTLSDPEGRMTIAQYIHGITERVYPVGRLDYDVE